MSLSIIWSTLVGMSLIVGIFSGKVDAVAAAALEGAGAAVNLCISIGGAICLWCGVMKVMEETGLLKGLTRLLRPLILYLIPEAKRNTEALDALSLNVSANFLGLGNAATPAGIKAAKLLAGGSEIANDGLCRLVVLNTASFQLIPATVCAIRASAGSSAPFEILPAVWISSAASIAAGLAVAYALKRVFK